LAHRLIAVTLAGLALATAGCGGLASRSPEVFPVPPADSVTFWGHACFRIDVAGFGIVTDPVFERTTILRFRRLPAPPERAYADTRIVLLSHAHPDHLSPSTLATFPDDVLILCPVPAEEPARESGREVRPMRPGDEYAIPGGRIVAVAAKHGGGRHTFGADTTGSALGWVIETERSTVYYLGDTNLFDGIGEVGSAYRPDVALVNINGHLHGLDALRAAWATRAPAVIPGHWGAYGWLGLPAPSEPRDAADLRDQPGFDLVELRPGESFALTTTRR
jgi:L-ascorbate metabolism protein UlaG (beta-lactamase superfamily)